jgi:ATP-dependent protease HslVU (ClpYQ) peptidase subunit
MSLVAAIVNETGVYMGCDCLVSCGEDVFKTKSRKVMHRGCFMLGITGDTRLIDLLAVFKFPKDSEACNSWEEEQDWLIRNFVPTWRMFLEKNGKMGTKDDKDCMPGNVLIASTNCIYKVSCDFNVCPLEDNYHAIGSGADIALGSLFSTTYLDATISPEEKIRLAVKAASYHINNVGGGCFWLSLPRESDPESKAALVESFGYQ